MGTRKNDILQGTLVLIVLRTLASNKRMHGYAISRWLSGTSGDATRGDAGEPETDRLIGVYNQMVDNLRDERARLREQNFFLVRVLVAWRLSDPSTSDPANRHPRVFFQLQKFL